MHWAAQWLLLIALTMRSFTCLADENLAGAKRVAALHPAGAHTWKESVAVSTRLRPHGASRTKTARDLLG